MDECFRKGYQSPTTFYKCIANKGAINRQWKHPKHSDKWNDTFIDNTFKYISNHQTATLDEIIIKMLENYGAPEISNSPNYSSLIFAYFKNVFVFNIFIAIKPCPNLGSKCSIRCR